MKLEKKQIKIIIIALIISAIALLTVILISTIAKPQKSEITSKSEFENMKAEESSLTYDKENEQTILTYKIKNISDKDITNQTINIKGLDESGAVIIANQMTISFLQANHEYNGEIKILGDLTKLIKTVEIQKPQITEQEPTE